MSDKKDFFIRGTLNSQPINLCIPHNTILGIQTGIKVNKTECKLIDFALYLMLDVLSLNSQFCEKYTEVGVDGLEGTNVESRRVGKMCVFIIIVEFGLILWVLRRLVLKQDTGKGLNGGNKSKLSYSGGNESERGSILSQNPFSFMYFTGMDWAKNPKF